jgi:hypothetical protein
MNEVRRTRDQLLDAISGNIAVGLIDEFVSRRMDAKKKMVPVTIDEIYFYGEGVKYEDFLMLLGKLEERIQDAINISIIGLNGNTESLSIRKEAARDLKETVEIRYGEKNPGTKKGRYVIPLTGGLLPFFVNGEPVDRKY